MEKRKKQLSRLADAFDMIGQHESAKILREMVSWLEFKPLPEIKAQHGIDLYLKGYER